MNEIIAELSLSLLSLSSSSSSSSISSISSISLISNLNNDNINNSNENVKIDMNLMNDTISKIRMIKIEEMYDIIDDNDYDNSISSEERYEQFANSLLDTGIRIMISMLADINTNTTNNDDSTDTNTVDRLNGLICNYHANNIDTVSMMRLMLKILSMIVTVSLQYYHNHRYNTDTNITTTTAIMKRIEIIIRIILINVYILSSSTSSSLSSSSSELLPIVVELENLIVILMALDFVIVIEPSSFLSLSQHEIIYNVRNTNTSTNSNNDTKSEVIMRDRVALISTLLNEAIFKASTLTVRQIINGKHKSANNGSTTNSLATLFFMSADTNSIATNTITKLRSIRNQKKIKTRSDDISYDITYSCTSLSRLWHLLPKNDIVDMIMAASLLTTLSEKQREIKHSDFLQTAGLVSVSQVALRLLEYYDDHHHQVSLLLLHTMINSTSSTIVTESSSYLFNELFSNWRAHSNPTTMMMSGRLIQGVVIGSSSQSSKKFEHMILEAFNSIVMLHYSSKQSIPIIIYMLPFFQHCTISIVYCHLSAIITSLLILLNKWDIGLQLCCLDILIVLIERCKDVIRFSYIKIATELIRMLIFYDGYNTKSNSHTTTLYDTSSNGLKVIDSIIASIRKCINMLKAVDTSIWDGIVNALHNNSNTNCSSIADIIKNFNLANS